MVHAVRNVVIPNSNTQSCSRADTVYAITHVRVAWR